MQVLKVLQGLQPFTKDDVAAPKSERAKRAESWMRQGVKRFNLFGRMQAESHATVKWHNSPRGRDSVRNSGYSIAVRLMIPNIHNPFCQGCSQTAKTTETIDDGNAANMESTEGTNMTTTSSERPPPPSCWAARFGMVALDVEFVGERTLEQRNAEGFANAIVIDDLFDDDDDD